MKQPLRNYCNGVIKTLSDTSMQQKVYRGVRIMSPYDMELITSHPELRKESLSQEQIKDVALNSEKPAFQTKTLYRINGGREDE